MPQRLDTGVFIKKSIAKFGQFLDYSLVEYKTSRKLVCLICPTHGKFTQKPNTHFNSKRPCPKCSKGVLSTAQFIKRAKKIHGKKFNYQQSIYISYKVDINITCIKHGVFLVDPARHLGAINGGCLKCAPNVAGTLNEFIKKSVAKHGYIYNYSLVKYKNNTHKIKIICDVHGVFHQSPANHYKYGCLKCSGKHLKSNKSFIDECIIVHKNAYNYSKTQYKGSFKKVAVICDKHGEFKILATNHLHGERGCPKCSCRISKNEIRWLDSLNIPNGPQYRNVYIKLDGKRYYVDGFNPDTQTVFEFNGDYWHGNPDIYNSNDIHPVAKITFGELWNRTISKQNHLKKHGYKIISIWESEFLAE